MLVHVIDVSSAPGRDPVEDFDTIRRELALFPADMTGAADSQTGLLAGKPQIVAANKIDALDDPDRLTRLSVHLERRQFPSMPFLRRPGTVSPSCSKPSGTPWPPDVPTAMTSKSL